jgi:hypothetical protein
MADDLDVDDMSVVGISWRWKDNGVVAPVDLVK